MALRFWFVASLTAGTVFGPMAAWLIEGRFPGVALWLTVGVPIAAMMAYMAGAFVLDRHAGSSPAFADSVYYLGFLFTLVALLFSLLSLRHDAGADFSGVVGRFGLALVTTIVGLSVRTLVTTFRGATAEELARSEAVLAEAATELRAEMERLSMDFVAFNKAHKQVLDTSTASVRKAYDGLAAGATQAAQMLAQTARAGAHDLERSLSEGSGSVATELRAAAHRLGEALEAAAAAMGESVGGAGGRIDAASEAVAGQLERAATTLARSVDAIAELPEGHFRDRLDVPLGSLEAALARLADVAVAVGQSAESAAAQQAALAGELDRLRGRLAELDGAAQRLPRVSQALDDVASATGAVGTEMTRHAAALQEELRRTRAQLAAEVAEIGRLRLDIQARNQAAAEAVGAVSAQAVEAARYLRDQLRGGRGA